MKLSTGSLPTSQATTKFQVHFVVSDLHDEEIRQTAEILYRDLLSRGLSVLMDDRNEPLSSKQAYARELALPLELRLTAATLSQGHVKLSGSGLKLEREINVEDTPEIVAGLATQI